MSAGRFAIVELRCADLLVKQERLVS